MRDKLLGRDAKDIDLEVYGLSADRLKDVLAAFGSVNTVGESFTVYKVADLDVSLPRRESKVGRGHRGFEVTGDPHLSVEEAARRRDFTINAIAWDPLTDEYHDPHHGRADLERRVLRAVDPRARSARTACACCARCSSRRVRLHDRSARRSISAAPSRWTICRANASGVKSKSCCVRPRVRRSASPLARDLGIVERLWPELHALIECPQDPEWHPEGDVWIHTLMVVDGARQRIDDLPMPKQNAVMLGALLHDVGKPSTTAFEDGRIRSRGHEAAGVPPATATAGSR